MNGIQCVRTRLPLIPRIPFWNRWRKRIERDPGKLGSPRNGCGGAKVKKISAHLQNSAGCYRILCHYQSGCRTDGNDLVKIGDIQPENR